VPIVLKSESLSLLEPSGPVEACNESALPLHLPWCNTVHTHTHTHAHIYISPRIPLCMYKQTKAYELAFSLILTHIAACCQNCMFLVKLCFHIIFQVTLVSCLMSDWKEKLRFTFATLAFQAANGLSRADKRPSHLINSCSDPVCTTGLHSTPLLKHSFSPWLPVYTRHRPVSVCLIVRSLGRKRFSEFALQFRHFRLSFRQQQYPNHLTYGRTRLGIVDVFNVLLTVHYSDVIT
jgi:hypothetical protein